MAKRNVDVYFHYHESDSNIGRETLLLVEHLAAKIEENGRYFTYYKERNLLYGHNIVDGCVETANSARFIFVILTTELTQDRWDSFLTKLGLYASVESGHGQDKFVPITVDSDLMRVEQIPTFLLTSRMAKFAKEWKNDDRVINRLLQSLEPGEGERVYTSQPEEEARRERESEQRATPSVSTSAIKEKESPMVFISYQWDNQSEIESLCQSLDGLGYNCWMDINKMGGGDVMNSQIDSGIRGCTVFVSCLTPKYARSKMCQQEVSLANELKKPIIPLLLEKMDWPPAGSMSMAFTGLLYIDIRRDVVRGANWKGPKFNELLHQLVKFIGQLDPPGEDQAAGST